nr:hypothetical protein Itr_chr09CG10630 [Ipomoea trifida]
MLHSDAPIGRDGKSRAGRNSGGSEALTVPVAVVLAFNTGRIPSDPPPHSNVTVTFGAAGVPVPLQTNAPFKFTVVFTELAADGAVNATIATHKNIQNAAYQEQPIVYYYIIFKARLV